MPKQKRQKLPETGEPDIEVIDLDGNPLLVMPLSQVLRQKLRHRVVLVCLRNAKGLIYLFKRPSSASGPPGEAWFPAAYGRVWAGESRYAAGTRILERVFGISGVEIYETASFSESAISPAGNVEATLFLTAKTSALPRLEELEGTDGIFVDREEFRAIIRDYPHMVTPLWNLALPYFFPA
ncbi:MAG: hypothetical protein LIP28_00825 [Deltaproteobacteria bacterium]|nr:hypothetical protein [Deltaproteobacteria bacterium]